MAAKARPLGKMDIVKLLRAKHGLGEFLEISTPTTGVKFADMADERPPVHRLVYNCPDQADDGLPYTFRTAEPTSRDAIAGIAAANRFRPSYDVVFVDPFHTYSCSALDLAGAFLLLRRRGIMVVHDCNPPNATIATPEHRPGAWCGVTYWAFIDFLMRRWDVGFYTVDTDYGCGVVYKHRPRAPAPRSGRAALARLAPSWAAVRHDDGERFDFFAEHRRDLLNLKTVDEFLALEGAPPAL